MIDANITTPAISQQFTPTVTASAYTSGFSMGGLLTVTGATRGPFAGGLIQAATVSFKSNVVPALDLILFNASPTGSTTADFGAVAIVAADLAKVIGVIHLTDTTSLGSTGFVQGQNQALPFVLGSGTTLYGLLVVRATPTLASTTDVTVTLQILQN